MNISLNVPVFCADGLAGTLTDLVLDANRRTLAGLVVKTKSKPTTEVIVPAERLVDVTPDHVRLGLTSAELRLQRPSWFEEVRRVPVPNYREMDDLLSFGLWKPIPYQERQMVLSRPNLNDNEALLGRRTTVWATDGRIGSLFSLVFDNATGRLTHLAAKPWLPWSEATTIPSEYISFLGEQNIRLKVSKQELKSRLSTPGKQSGGLAYS